MKQVLLAAGILLASLSAFAQTKSAAVTSPMVVSAIEGVTGKRFSPKAQFPTAMLLRYADPKAKAEPIARGQLRPKAAEK